MDHERRVAIVSGASSGFGRLTALTLADHEYRVFAVFRGSRRGFEATAAELEEAARGKPGIVDSVALDVADDESAVGWTCL